MGSVEGISACHIPLSPLRAMVPKTSKTKIKKAKENVTLILDVAVEKRGIKPQKIKSQDKEKHSAQHRSKLKAVLLPQIRDGHLITDKDDQSFQTIGQSGGDPFILSVKNQKKHKDNGSSRSTPSKHG